MHARSDRRRVARRPRDYRVHRLRHPEPSTITLPVHRTPGLRPDVGRLTISCHDRPGIVAAVAGFFAEQGANLIHADQHSSDPEGGRFFMRLEFHLDALASRRAGAHHTLRRDGRRALSDALADQPRVGAEDRRPVRLEERPLPPRHPLASAPKRAADEPRADRLEPRLAQERRRGLRHRLPPRADGQPRRRRATDARPDQVAGHRARGARPVHARPVVSLSRPRGTAPSSTSITRSCPPLPAPIPTRRRTSGASSSSAQLRTTSPPSSTQDRSSPRTSSPSATARPSPTCAGSARTSSAPCSPRPSSGTSRTASCSTDTGPSSSAERTGAGGAPAVI